MFKISRKVEYALIALKYMSQKMPGQLTTAKEICEHFQTPFDPTSRVLQIMTQHKILKAEQGAHGGYQIQKDLTKVSLSDINDIIVGHVPVASCLNSGSKVKCSIICECNVISPLIILNEKVQGLFKTIKISDLIAAKHQSEKTIKRKSSAS